MDKSQLNKSRTEHSARNMTYATIGRVAALLMGFASRVVFTHTLSQEYVGINGLFYDILNVLSLSELGLSTAIAFALYEPIAEEDIEKQKSLMNLYKHFYYIVAGIVTVLGLCVIPFMDVLIKNKPDVPHLTLIYLMYLVNAVISYFWIYKKTLLDAHQLTHIGVIYQTSSWIVQIIIQIIILITTHNFVLYLSIMLCSTLASNLLISRKADQLYPYLKDRNIRSLDKEEQADIRTNVKAMLMHKIGDVAVTNTDNLILSAVVGLVAAGLYSNYYLIIDSVRGVILQIFNGINASVGNLGVTEDRGRVKRIFEATFYLGNWAYGLAAICMYEILDTFVGLSFGDNYVFSGYATLLLCLNFYVTGMCQANFVFRDSLGLFYYDRYKSIVAAVINLVVSIVLGNVLGVEGVFIGTLVSTIATSFWVEPLVLYKERLHCSVWPYFGRYAIYAASTGGLWVLCNYLCALVHAGRIVTIILRLLICLIVVNSGYLLILGHCKEYRLLKDKGIGVLRQKFPGLFHNSMIMGKTNDTKAFVTEAVDSMSKSADKDTLLTLLSVIINEDSKGIIENYRDIARPGIAKIAKNTGTAAMLYPYVENGIITDADDAQAICRAASESALRLYRILYAASDLIADLKDAGVDVVLIKGPSLSARYPVPEYREFGDIDLLLCNKEDSKRAQAILTNHNCVKSRHQYSHHHIVYIYDERVPVELHLRTVRAFDNDVVNNSIDDIFRLIKEDVTEENILGFSYPVMRESKNGLYMLLHMLQHFLNSGFGLRLLCDWTVYWNRTIDFTELEEYKKLTAKLHLTQFSDVITVLCAKKLGLREEYAGQILSDSMLLADNDTVSDAMALLDEIFEAGKFGEKDQARLVATRDSSVSSLFLEFHHQTRENYPRASKLVVLWPGLWIITFIRFVNNNRSVRKISSIEIIKSARRRAALVKRLDIWK